MDETRYAVKTMESREEAGCPGHPVAPWPRFPRAQFGNCWRRDFSATSKRKAAFVFYNLRQLNQREYLTVVCREFVSGGTLVSGSASLVLYMNSR